MDTKTYGGPQETIEAIEKLTETINRNNEITAEQNQKMVKYNKRLLVLTYVIGALALFQLLVGIYQCPWIF